MSLGGFLLMYLLDRYVKIVNSWIMVYTGLLCYDIYVSIDTLLIISRRTFLLHDILDKFEAEAVLEYFIGISKFVISNLGVALGNISFQFSKHTPATVVQ